VIAAIVFRRIAAAAPVIVGVAVGVAVAVGVDVAVPVAVGVGVLELQRGVHVALDLSDVQRSIVNPDLVYSSRKILAVNAVSTDLQRIR